MTKTIRNRNKRGEYHGYQQWHIFNKLAHRGNWNNGSRTGYLEWHYYKIQTTYYIR